MNMVGIPVSILQKRLRFGEVKEHAHDTDHQESWNGLLGKIKASLSPNDPDIYLHFPKGLYIDTMSDCVTITPIIHLMEISSYPGSIFHVGWSEVLAQGPSSPLFG